MVCWLCFRVIVFLVIIYLCGNFKQEVSFWIRFACSLMPEQNTCKLITIVIAGEKVDPHFHLISWYCVLNSQVYICRQSQIFMTLACIKSMFSTVIVQFSYFLINISFSFFFWIGKWYLGQTKFKIVSKLLSCQLICVRRLVRVFHCLWNGVTKSSIWLCEQT